MQATPLLAWFVIAASLATLSALPQKGEPRESATVICAVSASEPPEMTMDVVVVVENGKLRPPFAEQDATSSELFARKYFAAGRKYRLTFGGGEIGSATVKKFEQGCNNVHATVIAQGGTKIRGAIMGLATTSETLGRKESSRRAPTAEERAAVMQLVNEIYRARKVTPAMLRLLSTTNLVATDLNGDGKVELVGSFLIQTKTKARRDLLLIAEQQAAMPLTFKAALVDYQSYTLPPEEFDSAIDFVDQLDLDGDGTAEVITRQNGFDAYGYLIYKKQMGRWKRVYSFIGDAC